MKLDTKILCLIFMLFAWSSRANDVSDLSNLEMSIKHIDSLNLTRAERELPASEASQGGRLEIYKEGAQTKKINVKLMSETGYVIIKAYFDNKAILGLARERYIYEQSIYDHSQAPKVKREENDFWLIKNKKYYQKSHSSASWIEVSDSFLAQTTHDFLETLLSAY